MFGMWELLLFYFQDTTSFSDEQPGTYRNGFASTSI